MGQGIGRIHEITPARELVEQIVEDFYKTHEYMNQLVNNLSLQKG